MHVHIVQYRAPTHRKAQNHVRTIRQYGQTDSCLWVGQEKSKIAVISSVISIGAHKLEIVVAIAKRPFPAREDQITAASIEAGARAAQDLVSR